MAFSIDNLIKAADNKYAARVSEGNEADVEGFIDTGSYALNAILSGSIYGGLPSNKVTALAGEPSTGKTFYALNIVKEFLIANPEGAVFYFDTESAVTTDILEEREINTEQFVIIPVITIQDFRSQAIRILDAYLAEDEKNRKPIFMVLDSLGMLSTNKEVTDISEGKDTRDMTRAQLIRGAFRVLTLKLGRAKVALLVTNHTYDVVGAYIPTKEMCLVSGTKIRMYNGTLQNIEDLNIGEYVETVDGFGEITNKFEFDVKELYRLTMDDGSIVECTGEHKFLVNDEWVSALTMMDMAKNMKILDIELMDIRTNENELRKALSIADRKSEE